MWTQIDNSGEQNFFGRKHSQIQKCGFRFDLTDMSSVVCPR